MAYQTFSPDDQVQAIIRSDYWKARTGELRGTLTGHWDAVKVVVFSPDGGREPYFHDHLPAFSEQRSEVHLKPTLYAAT